MAGPEGRLSPTPDAAVVTVPGSWAVIAMAPLLMMLASLDGQVAGMVGVGATAVASSFFLVRSVQRDGDELHVRYIAPRRRTIPMACVLGTTTQAGIWLTRIELRGSCPLVLTGRPRGASELVA